jgi:endonuclease YncB( thermonuclease family)
MKKTKLLTSLFAAFLCVLGVSSCGDVSSLNSSVAVASSEASNASSSSAVSSSEVSSESSSSSSAEESSVAMVDYVNDGSVKLLLDYKNHNFFTDGVGQVTLKSPIDGDTAHFYTAGSTSEDNVIKARFYGIDTPESTGKVEEWGKPASMFTTEKLQEANKNGTIVVSAPVLSYTAPSFDSTGTRYVSLVFINLTVKDAPYDSLVCLNLWIVQEGFSLLKGVSDMPSYEDTFYKAAEQARNLKLNMYSGKPDPYFNYGGYEDTTILEIKEEVEKTIADPTHVNSYNNKKVRLQGTVAGFANHTLYLENYFTPEHGGRVSPGEYAGINVYTGMTTIPSKFTIKNTYIEICGLCLDSDTFGFQITSVTFAAYSTSDTDAKVVIKAADNIDYALKTFELSPDAMMKTDYSYLNCAVKLTGNVIVTGGYKSDSDAYTLYLSYNGIALYFDVYIPFLYKPDPDNQPTYTYSSVDSFKGHTFTLSGVYTVHFSSSKTYFQINPSTSYDFLQVA